MRSIVLGAFCLGSLASCSATENNVSAIDPSRDFSARVINTTLDSLSDSEIIDSTSITVARRNSVIQARLAELDLIYNAYERRLSSDVRSSNFGFSLTQLLVGTAGTLAGARASQNLSAASAVLAGSQAAYDRDILLDQTLQAAASQMRANRNRVKERILQRLQSNTPDYTLQMALSDLAAYEQAGTLTSALASLSETAAGERRTSEVRLEGVEDRLVIERTVRRQNFGIHGRNLAEYLESGTFPTDQDARFQIVTDCYRTTFPNSSEVSFGEFLPISENDPAALAEIVACMRERYQINIGS